MTTFDRREEAFEKRFALDEEQKFKAIARRSRLFGLWVAERLGLTDAAAQAYAKEVVGAEVDGGDQGLIRKVMADLAAKGDATSEQALQAKIAELTAKAAAEVKAGA